MYLIMYKTLLLYKYFGNKELKLYACMCICVYYVYVGIGIQMVCV